MKDSSRNWLNLAFLPVVLVLFYLIKIGQITQNLLVLVIKLLSLSFRSGKKLLVVPKRKKHRGRPRTLPAREFYSKKISRRLNIMIPRPSRFRYTLGFTIIILAIYSVTLVKLVTSLPSPHQITQSNNPLTTQIYDRNGKILYQFYEGRNRKLIKLEELPDHLVKATIAMEDKNFYTHPGIDLGGISRAIRNNWTDEGSLQGGSTITQQLVKNTMLTPDKTYTRKIKEVLLSLWAEKIYSKDQILEAYFNEVPYGGPAWGIESASEMYFGKSAKDLNIAESTYLTGLTAAPTQYSPYGTSPEKARDRQKDVLRRMVEDGYITPEDATIVYNQELEIRPPTQDIKAAHFVMYVRSVLAEKYGERAVSQGGLKVTTTLDLGIQEMAENAVFENVEKLASLRVGNGAAMVTDVKTGHILAMVGSKDYFDPKGGNYNVALALRQPGSSIKPVTYATGFKLGYGPGTILLDSPTTFKNAWESYSPVNYDGKFHGAVTVRTALGSSYNIPAVKMLALVGLPQMIQTAKDMGITTFTKPDNYGLSLTLGGGEVRMLDMISVYNTFATGGVRLNPQPVLLVTDIHGNVLEDNREPSGKRAIPEEVAYLVSDILADKRARIPAFGANSLLEIKNHSFVAVKTGTSDQKRDNWAFGYTPEYVVGAWVGNMDNSPMHQNLASGITGATPIWHDIMSALLEDRPDIAFKRPETIIEKTIDGRRDLSINGMQPKSTVSYQRIKKKDEATGEEKEITAYSDPFSNFIPDPNKQTTQ